MRIRFRSGAIAIAVAVAPLPACSGSTDSDSVTIQVLDNAFSPGSVTVAPGTRVSFAWNGTSPHNVVFAPGSGLPSSAIQTSGSFSITPETPGTWAYECTLHPGMTGTLIVR